MSIKDLPEQINFLDGANYQLSIARLPMTTFTVQEATLPSVYLPEINTGNPFVKLNFAASNIEFSNFRVTFKVDEDFKNYIELFNWLSGLGFPEEHSQYSELVANPTGFGGKRSDASLVISTSSKIVHKSIRFRDVFPMDLSDLTFSTTSNYKPVFLTARVTFSIRDFYFENVIA